MQSEEWRRCNTLVAYVVKNGGGLTGAGVKCRVKQRQTVKWCSMQVGYAVKNGAEITGVAEWMQSEEWRRCNTQVVYVVKNGAGMSGEVVYVNEGEK